MGDVWSFTRGTGERPYLLLLFFVLWMMMMTTMISSDVEARRASSFSRDFRITWAPDHVQVLDKARQLHLSLDQQSGSAFQSKSKYLFGKIDMEIKLVPGDSAGTVTAYYLYSEAENRDEIDLEFLGNRSGHPYILQTNVFAKGKGEREQRIYLWFDPTADFHKYTVLWTPQQILFLVDDIPIRRFVNQERLGVPFPNNQPMGIYSSLWNGDGWATQGGREKIDWTQAPFVASYRNFNAEACVVNRNMKKCKLASSSWDQRFTNSLNPQQQAGSLHWVKENFMIYDYCTDLPRNPHPPTECAFN